jgi:hypothetical protein
VAPATRAVPKAQGAEDRKHYWDATYEPLNNSIFQELLAETLYRRWERVDVITNVLVLATASGSAIAGWALWGTPTGRFVWVAIAGVAAVCSVIHSAMKVPSKLKERGQARQDFIALRVDYENFRNGLAVGVDARTKTEFVKLQERYARHMKETSPDLITTKQLLEEVQNRVLKMRGLD